MDGHEKSASVAGRTRQTTLFGSFVPSRADAIFSSPTKLYEHFVNVLARRAKELGRARPTKDVLKKYAIKEWRRSTENERQ